MRTTRLSRPLRIRFLAAAGVLFTGIVSASDRVSVPDSLQVADGFEVERVASNPLIQHPIMAAFDDRGRLYVAENTGENMDAKQLAARNPGRIRRLEDRDGDGRYDAATTFATGLTMPMGAQWHAGALYVAAPPDILRLEDADGDGFAERRSAIVTGFVYTGNGADNHGPFLGPDGWLYFTHGRHGYHLPTREGTVLHGLASQVFRCRPDGKDLQRVCGGGFDNPVEVAFLRSGEMFGTLTFYSDPTDGLRDALVHWVERGVYPKVDDCLKEFSRSGPLLPALRFWPAVAPSGLMIVRGNGLGDDAVGNLVTAQFNTALVQRHPIRRDGATFRATDIDLLRSSDPDFHPTDVLEDADGSLLVVNTGGWFRRGCPRSVIAKPDVLGAIYRVRRAGVARPDDPWGRSIAWTQATPRQLVALLGDGRFSVRDHAVDELAGRGETAVEPLAEALTSSPDVESRTQALWALARIGTAATRAVLRKGLADPHVDVRVACCRALGLARDREATPKLIEMIARDEPPVRRQAATAVGQIGAMGGPNAQALLHGLKAATNPDPFLEHAIIQALIDGNDAAGTRPGLRDANPTVRRGALIALDQMAGGGLTADDVLPLLDGDDPALRTAALAVVERHPSWAREILGVLADWLRRAEGDKAVGASLRGSLLAFEKESAVQSWIAQTLASRDTSVQQRGLLLDVIGKSRLATLPESWQAALGDAVASDAPALRQQAINALRVQRISRFDDRLEAIARRADESAELRLAALGALGGRPERRSPELFAFLTSRLAREQTPLSRLAAAEVLAAVPLSEDQAVALAAELAEADPLILTPLLGAFRRHADLRVGRELVAALERRDAAGKSLPSDLDSVLKAYPPEIASKARPLLDRLEAGRGEAKARLGSLAGLTQGGDPARGRAVFFGNKAGCFGCHRVAGEGGSVGPDLSTIGVVRSGRDLLEAVVFPSASFAQGFEPVTVASTDGRVLSGVIARRDGDSVVLRTADRAEVRLGTGEVEEIRPSATSIMPQGLDTILSPEELRDLLSYLQQRK